MRVLPASAILSALLCLSPGAALAEMDRETCRISAGLEAAIATVLRRHIQAVEGIAEPMALKQWARPEMQEQARRAVEAQRAHLRSARDYAEAVDALAASYRQFAR